MTIQEKNPTPPPTAAQPVNAPPQHPAEASAPAEDTHKTEHRLERLKWWTEFVILPLIISTALITLFVEGPDLIGKMRGEKSVQQQMEETREITKGTADTLQKTSEKLIGSLAKHLQLSLGHSSQAGNWTAIDEDTFVIPSTDSVQAQLVTDAGSPYLLEADGHGAVSLLSNDTLKDKYGSRYNIAPTSETIIGLVLDPTIAADKIPAIEARMKSVFANRPPLPEGRHIIWRPEGWTWVYQKGLKAPDPEGAAKEAQYKQWADEAQIALKETLPEGTRYYGHTVAVK